MSIIDKVVSSVTSKISNAVTNVAANAASNLLSISTSLNNVGNASSASILKNTSSLSPAAAALSPANLVIPDLASGLISDTALPTTPSVLTSSPNLLAVPTFTSGPTDDLASIDIYSAPNSGVIVNSMQSIIPSELNNALASFKGSSANTSNLNNLVNGAAGALTSLSKINPLSQIAQQVPAMFSGLKNLPKGCGGELTSNLIKDLNKVNKYSGSMNGHNFNFRSSKVNCINGIGNVLNTLATSNGCKTTPFSFPNPTAALSSLVNAGKHALTIGIPGVFSALVCGLTDALNINKLASRLALPVSSSSDLNSLISMASLTTPGALIKSVPNLISSFSKKFSLSAPGITGGAGDFSSMIGSYDLLKPDWNIANTIGNGDITDLSSVMDASDDFYQTVISGIDSASNLTNISNNTDFTDSVMALSNDMVPNQDLLYAPTFLDTDTDPQSCLTSDFPEIPTPESSILPINIPAVNPVTLANNTLTSTSEAAQSYMSALSASTNALGKQTIAVVNNSLISTPVTHR